MNISLSIKNSAKRDQILIWALVGLGMLAMYVPSFFDLFRGIWRSSDQAHGPIVFLVSLWLLYQGRVAILDCEDTAPKPVAGWLFILFSGFSYVLGRSQSIVIFEIGSLIGMLIGLLLLLRGPQQLKRIWFALFFMLFMIPLPGTFVDAVTHPMKMAVSYVSELVLYNLGYPIARSGVILQIGQYQLLVADACAGLHTLFTLEALGLLYLNLVRHSSLFRNISLAILIVPISFTANVIRVMVLTLVTYYLGDEAGQGFLHGFAGMVLFVSALLLIIGADTLLRTINARRACGLPVSGDAA